MTTGTSLVFPAGLPCPQELPTQSAERRVLNDALTEARVGQTDRLDYEDYVFPPYSPAQALTLDEFWRVTLNKGGKWFSTLAPYWPRPEGRTPAARRFIGPPRWEFIHTGKPEIGYWRVSGTFEVRGVGELPVEPDPPSAWNPDDMITQAPPSIMALTEAYRVATRETTSDWYESGVRGFLSHAALGNWYFELEILDIGIPGHTQNMQFGMLDATMTKEYVLPATGSNPSNASTFVVCSSRTADGIVFSSYPTFNASPGAFGTPPVPGDVYGFAWNVGTNVRIYRNNVLGVTATLPTVAAMFPYFNAGSTNANGANTAGTGESIRIRTGKKQFAYTPPTGYLPWG